ncbi:MAG: selenium metabolism-associated LysR family transcriptional regulator [Sedimentibacter sp.]
MNTSYLVTFIEVINLKNISKAAERLFITQPAVSKQLQILEKDFGAELIKKQGREIVPTEAGQLLYKYAKTVLSEENKIYSLLKRDDNALKGNLDIYSSSMPADYYLHDLIIEFSNLYPRVTFAVKKIDSQMVFKNIEDGFTSFGFTGTQSKNKKIKNICIAEDEVVIVASYQKKNEINQDKTTLNMILNERFILRENGSATLKIFENYLNKKSVKLNDLNVIIQAEDNETIKKFISKNMGIAVLPKKAVEKEIEDGNMFVINIEGMDLKRKLYYVYQQDRYFSNIEEKFKEFMVEKYK